MQQPSSFSSSLTRRHPQYEPAAAPATRFSGSGRGRQHARPSSLPTTRLTVHPGKKEEAIHKSVQGVHSWMSMCTAWSPCLFLLPLSISVGVSDRHAWLRRLFFCLFGRKGRTSRGRGGSSPWVLWGELRFASEDVSVLGRRCCVAATQGDQQRCCIVPGNPFIGLQRRLRASCVWVKVYLKQIWLWGQKRGF